MTDGSWVRFRSASYEAYVRSLDSKTEERNNKRLRRTALFNKLQSHYGCVECGLTDHRYLHWNHVNPDDKYLKVSQLYLRPFSVILKELRKCNVLCHACHQEETKRQREAGAFRSTPRRRLTREQWERGREAYLLLRDN